MVGQRSQSRVSPAILCVIVLELTPFYVQARIPKNPPVQQQLIIILN